MEDKKKITGEEAACGGENETTNRFKRGAPLLHGDHKLF